MLQPLAGTASWTFIGALAGHLRLYPTGSPLPVVSAINYSAGQTRANNAIAPLSGDGRLSVRAPKSRAPSTSSST